jgi:membrane-associated phospholipid phosphatase
VAEPALLWRTGTLSSRLRSRLESVPPWKAASVVAIAGYVVLACLLVGLGFLTTKVLVHTVVEDWDAAASRWFAAHRTSSLDTWTDIGSILAGTGTIVAIAAVSVVICALRRRWRSVVLVAVALFVEVTVFLTTTLLVERARPDVPRLDPSPGTSSFPSGHVAASIALYVGLAVLLTTPRRAMFLRGLIWIIAIWIPAWVAVSRVYRGMHHPTDVLAGALLGSGALIVGVLAARTIRDRRRDSSLEAASHPIPSKVKA